MRLIELGVFSGTDRVLHPVVIEDLQAPCRSTPYATALAAEALTTARRIFTGDAP